jgi:3',5'-cyclic AMP phosphodiesterase CpdA
MPSMATRTRREFLQIAGVGGVVFNALPRAPDFVVFTGDLTHTTDDDQERRRRMAQFREH